MYAFYFTAFATMLSMTAALPQVGTFGSGTTVGDAVQKCGNDQTLSCCNNGTETSEASGGLAGSSGLAGGQCAPVPVSVLGDQVPINYVCGNNQIACCGSTNQQGVVNVALDCDPLSLF